jgi:hypothetical protein
MTTILLTDDESVMTQWRRNRGWRRQLIRGDHEEQARRQQIPLSRTRAQTLSLISVFIRFMNKEYWERACNAAISRPLRDATNAWGAVVVSCDAHMRVAAPR